jgi:hypothetical protein
MPLDQAHPASIPAGHRLLSLNVVVGKRAQGSWGGLKFRPSQSAFGAKLRSSIWVRNIRRQSNRVFLCLLEKKPSAARRPLASVSPSVPFLIR